MKFRVVLFALITLLAAGGTGWAESLRLFYGANLQGEVLPCG